MSNKKTLLTRPESAVCLATLIDDLRAGKIHYAPEIAAKIRQRELTVDDFPCKRFILHPEPSLIDAGQLATEIVPHGSKPRYKGTVTIESKLSARKTARRLKKATLAIHDLSNELYIQGGESLMVLLEGDNADGKDGLLKHVFRLNPQTTSGTHAFKAATAEQQSHAGNWRFMQHLAGPGQLGFHNRTAYGDIVFASSTASAKEARREEIAEMQYGLTMGLPMTPDGRISLPDGEGHVSPTSIQRPPMRFIKVLLNISEFEQAARLADRLTEKHKLYKESQADVDGHPEHDAVQSAFVNAMAADSTPWAPSYLIPNDNKKTGWRKMSQITRRVLTEMNPEPPRYRGKLDSKDREREARPLLQEVSEHLRKDDPS
jgi:polyphosphate kinase 2 (PPK2 family)